VPVYRQAVPGPGKGLFLPVEGIVVNPGGEIPFCQALVQEDFFQGLAVDYFQPRPVRDGGGRVSDLPPVEKDDGREGDGPVVD